MLLQEFPKFLLENVGKNDCYANATFQSVFRVIPLVKYLLKHGDYLTTHKTELVKRYEDHHDTLTRRLEAEISRTLERSPRDDPQTALLWETLVLLSEAEQQKAKRGKGKGKKKAKEEHTLAVRAESMYTTLVRSSVDSVIGRMEDAHAARECLLENLHCELVAASELARTRHTDAPRDLTLQQAGTDMSKRTAVSDISRGELKSTVTCDECGHVSITDREATWSLSVQIPAAVVDLTEETGQQPSADGRECVQSFFKPEELKGREQYFCERCGHKCNATKRLSMATVPPALCNETHVLLPEELDVSPYAQKQTEGHILTSVIEHRGSSLHSGHYVEYHRHIAPNGQSKWLVFDDQVNIIEEVSLDFVLQHQAYMATYVQPNALAAVSPPELAEAPADGPDAAQPAASKKVANRCQHIP
ncbi:unnamed protein product [Vitrella brassicaformis CCMP3155]|uniref:USP domain-containing protein n=1 Tax=Vitrella brassicaformis (strain CCMP3155) TaxID=1169540 RepID=A0A0G4EXJ1_VITBC|nr:unnamed protein product [Vitrella brassicaformis CCMP3155]|eukprot:CEM03533.1 unnamed protein product [Vitrella brassicaformis CCMP3155]